MQDLNVMMIKKRFTILNSELKLSSVLLAFVIVKQCVCRETSHYFDI